MVCLVDVLAACLRIRTGFKGIPSEGPIYESTLPERQNCSHNMSQIFEGIRRFADFKHWFLLKSERGKNITILAEKITKKSLKQLFL